jgi:hypothetical protein
MPAKVMVLPVWQKGYRKTDDMAVVMTTSRSKKEWERALSPFFLGPVDLYGKFKAKNVENAWQFSKVYKEHVEDDEITKDYFKWAKAGWEDSHAHRYPMGKGVGKPLFSLWDGDRLGYVPARKRIYAPLYARAVLKTASYDRLVHLYREKRTLVLLDFDAYNHWEEKMSLEDVLNCPDKKMGHAFVLAMLLTKDDACHQFLINSLP